MPSLWLIVGLLAPLVAAQSPGPDWPNCAVVSRGSGGPWGWEMLSFKYNPIMRRRDDAQEAALSIDVQNIADGSRTVCSLSARAANQGTLVLSNQKGGCETYWISRYSESWTKDTRRGPTASVTYDTEESVLSINQTWTCREANGQLSTFSGGASERLDITCYGGREGERTSCGFASTPESLSYSKIAMLFLFGTTAEPVSTPANSPTPPIDCATSTPSWQILSMYYNPPGPWPKSTSYWPTEIRFELRNLADGSRTKCYLAQEDASKYETGILLQTDSEKLGAPADFPNRLRGCETGTFSAATEDRKPQWRGSEVAEVTFDTKTQIFTVNQTWSCPGGKTMAGHVEQMLSMDCAETGLSFVPFQCEPKAAVFSSSSTPVVLGPGTAALVE